IHREDRAAAEKIGTSRSNVSSGSQKRTRKRHGSVPAWLGIPGERKFESSGERVARSCATPSDIFGSMAGAGSKRHTPRGLESAGAHWRPAQEDCPSFR